MEEGTATWSPEVIRGEQSGLPLFSLILLCNNGPQMCRQVRLLPESQLYSFFGVLVERESFAWYLKQTHKSTYIDEVKCRPKDKISAGASAAL